MKNKKLVRFLTVVLVIVWGVIAYQIIAALYSSDEDTAGNISLSESDSHFKKVPYQYKDDVRDPFAYKAQVKKENTLKVVKSEIKKPEWTPPPFRLTGILTNESKRTSVLEGNDGTVSFLREGDTLTGVQISKITENKVFYLWQKKKGEWSLQ